jgi:flagellar basal body rod protein FlgG
MLISTSTMRALDDVAARERDALQAFAPGATPERNDVARPSTPAFTLDALSAMPPADAYFVTRDHRGRVLFTRDGVFSIQDGVLVDQARHPILGFTGDASSLTELRADPVDTALGFPANARIEPDGLVTYERTTVDPRTGRREPQRATMGRIALARFAPATKLQAIDAEHAAAPPGIEPHIGRPGDGNFAPIAPLARAGSGIDLDLSLQRLQEAYLALEAIRAADQSQRSVEKTAMELLK